MELIQKYNIMKKATKVKEQIEEIKKTLDFQMLYCSTKQTQNLDLLFWNIYPFLKISLKLF